MSHKQKEESLTVTKSLNCLETSFGPFFIAFSSSFSFDLRFFTSSVMLSTDNLQTEKSHFIREKKQCYKSARSVPTPLLRDASLSQCYPPAGCRQDPFINICIYILLDGLTYNTRGYFASCVVFFRAPQGRGKTRAMSKMSASIC